VKITAKKGFTRGHRITFKMRGKVFIPLNLKGFPGEALRVGK